jgi:hypothetical protein
MRILRLGGVNATTSRFIDLVSREEIEHVDFFIHEAEERYFDDYIKSAKYFREDFNINKIAISKYRLNRLDFYAKKTLKILRTKKHYDLFYRGLKTLKRNKYDLIWVGDNDFDGSNDLFMAVREIFDSSKIVRSYKETRFLKKYTEYEMLRYSDALIFPNFGYIDFFKRLYNIEISKYDLADLDWRYSKTINWVKSQEVEKLSRKDSRPHCCILSGRALSDPSEERSGDRYYFIPIIKELINREIVVHLHAQRIIASQNRSIDAYHELAGKNSNLIIEEPLKLMAGSEDYKILKRYDAGILHAETQEKNLSLYEFQKINIPNRIYEYQMCGVLPIIFDGDAIETKKLIKKSEFGIIYSSYDDLASKLYYTISSSPKELDKIFSFRDFSNILLGQ